jgi:uncharacterized protein (UPF0276 family)
MKGTSSIPVGIAFRAETETVADDPLVTALEETYERVENPLELMDPVQVRASYHSLHCLRMSPASDRGVDERYLDEVLQRITESGRYSALSDHLGTTTIGDVELGHFVPPQRTRTCLNATVDNVNKILSRSGFPSFFLENIAHFGHPDQGLVEMTELQFIRRLVEETGVGILLDVTNAYANSLNLPADYPDVEEYLEEMIEIAPRLQIHVAGGHYAEDGCYLDSHAYAVPDEVWALLGRVVRAGGTKTQAVFIERDNNLEGEHGLLNEILRARSILSLGE